MGNPACKKEDCSGSNEIGRRKQHGVGVKEITDVVQRHNDHHQPAQGVNGQQARARFRELIHAVWALLSCIWQQNIQINLTIKPRICNQTVENARNSPRLEHFKAGDRITKRRPKKYV